MSSSWRLYMVVRQGFFAFFNCSSRFLSKLWSVKLYSKINMVLNTWLFWRVQVFLFLHFEVQFFLRYLLRWCYVILDNFPSCFMIRKLLRMRYLNPSFSSLDLSWVIFHLKLSLGVVAIYGAHKWPKFFIYPPGEISFSSPCSYQFNPLFFVSGRISPQDFEMLSISPQ